MSNLTYLRIYASGDGSLIIHNVDEIPLTAEDILEYIEKKKPNLTGYLPHNVNKGHPCYWRLYRPLKVVDNTIVDLITNKTYKLEIDQSQNSIQNYITLHAITLTDETGDEVRSLSVKMAVWWWLNNYKSLTKASNAQVAIDGYHLHEDYPICHKMADGSVLCQDCLSDVVSDKVLIATDKNPGSDPQYQYVSTDIAEGIKLYCKECKEKI